MLTWRQELLRKFENNCRNYCNNQVGILCGIQYLPRGKQGNRSTFICGPLKGCLPKGYLVTASMCSIFDLGCWKFPLLLKCFLDLHAYLCLLLGGITCKTPEHISFVLRYLHMYYVFHTTCLLWQISFVESGHYRCYWSMLEMLYPLKNGNFSDSIPSSPLSGNYCTLFHLHEYG